jgi:hypothetical protein
MNPVDKSNLAFALITSILSIYIAVALLLSRARRSQADKSGRRGTAGLKH